MNTSYTPVPLNQIRNKLDEIEQTHLQNNQLRASLFNLIVYTQKNDKLPYFIALADQITEHFPCRVIFIEEDLQADEVFLNASIAAKMIDSSNNPAVICDRIYLSTSSGQIERIQHLLLEHTLIDMPIYLLWGQDPTESHPLFEYLAPLAKRLIFHSECSQNLKELATKLKDNIVSKSWEVADLNWIYLQEWREVIMAIFNDANYFADLQQTTEIHLQFCATPSEYFYHNHFQVHYMHAWLSSQLNWSFVSTEKDSSFQKITYDHKEQQIHVHLTQKACGIKASPGTLLQLQLKTKSQKIFTFQTNAGDEMIHIEIKDEQKPGDLYNTSIMKEKWQLYLSKEICYKQTSQHYENMLKTLSSMDGLT